MGLGMTGVKNTVVWQGTFLRLVKTTTDHNAEGNVTLERLLPDTFGVDSWRPLFGAQDDRFGTEQVLKGV